MFDSIKITNKVNTDQMRIIRIPNGIVSRHLNRFKNSKNKLKQTKRPITVNEIFE